MEALEGFIHHLKLETQLIDESLDCRKLFHNLVSKFTSDGLFLSTIPNFVGVGAVRYVPPILKPLSEDEVHLLTLFFSLHHRNYATNYPEK